MKYIVTNEMNGIMEILDSKGVIAHANSIGGYDIDSLNSAMILLKREGYRVFESQDENRTLSGMDIEDFYEWMNSDNVIKNRDGSYSTQDSNFRNRIGSIDELKMYYKREFGGSYAKGGKTKRTKDEYGNTTGVYEGLQYTLLNFPEGWQFMIHYYSPLLQTEKTYFSSEDFSSFRTKRSMMESLNEKIEEINKELNEINSSRKYAKGGKVDSNFEMVKSQAKELMHHSKELMQVLKKHPHIEAWVVAKIERATTDLSDVTHYLDGTFAEGGIGKYEKGGEIPKAYTHFIVRKSDNKIINGYDYKGVDSDDIKYFTKEDFKEMEISPKDFSLVGKTFLISKGIDPYNVHNWTNTFAKGGRINYSEYYKMGGKVASCEKFDENGERKIDLKSIKELTDCVNKLPQTKDFYFVNGEYTPERKRLHKQIIYNIKKDLVCVQNDNPIAILMGGSPASGKSTFLKRYRPYLLEEEILKVDADEIRSKLPEYEGYNATQTHLETKDIVNLLLSDRNIGIPCKFDLIYDGTMNSTKSYLPLIDLLKSLGYKIFVVYMDKVPKDVVVNRALQRYKKSGRFVPLEVIEDFFEKGKTALNEVKQKVDGYMVIDGSNTDYKVIEKGGMQLPKSRVYSKIGEPIKITPDKVVRDYKFGGKVNM